MEVSHRPWGWGLALSFADVSAPRVHCHCPGVSHSFLASIPPKPLFHHFTIWIFLLRNNVKIISIIRGSSLTFARFIDTYMAVTIHPKALVTGSIPSWNTTSFTQHNHSTFGKTQQQSRDFSWAASGFTHSLPVKITLSTHLPAALLLGPWEDLQWI